MSRLYFIEWEGILIYPILNLIAVVWEVCPDKIVMGEGSGSVAMFAGLQSRIASTLRGISPSPKVKRPVQYRVTVHDNPGLEGGGSSRESHTQYSFNTSGYSDRLWAYCLYH